MESFVDFHALKWYIVHGCTFQNYFIFDYIIPNKTDGDEN